MVSMGVVPSLTALAAPPPVSSGISTFLVDMILAPLSS